MGGYEVPGVYVEEIPHTTSIVQSTVTCLPLFIGYTEKAIDQDGRLLARGERCAITSFIEYERCFGQGAPEILRVMLDVHGRIVTKESYSPFYLHACMRQYFANGGGVCEILSLGPFPEAPHAKTLASAIAQLPANPSFTMVAIPDAVSLEELPQLQQQLLQYCEQQHHCLAVLDVPYCNDISLNTTVAQFRHHLGQQGLRHGAAFLPWLAVAIPSTHQFAHLEIKYTPGVANAWSQYHKATKLQSTLLRKRMLESPDMAVSRMIPPSATVIGLFHANDLQRGVWKLPSHVQIKEVQSLAAAINDERQASLNIDKDEGKSINVIRRFAGKGILLWGGRTLAGNDAEWRYISVARTHGFINASLHRYLAAQHFKANDAATWTAVRESFNQFLLTFWRAGGLAGNKPEQAFYVKSGLNETMTSEDVAAGRLIIDIGLAFLRPAEFMTLRIQHAVTTDRKRTTPSSRKTAPLPKKTRVRAKTSPLNVAIKNIAATQAKPPSLEPS
ncbi:phage tail sheath family protein [Methylobacillus flagellatus]|uniref:phage tail sheath family protein n=1 Tax=Methylobacillus flagellatus TaxID=405 RepID=UPI00285400EB|nr:phage tail sheath C-terminal domain-containing protein [Methylobacillus flagellatus]MDR5170977.1 phage tail sheath family protein [Methylobacillus flagellatus]